MTHPSVSTFRPPAIMNMPDDRVQRLVHGLGDDGIGAVAGLRALSNPTADLAPTRSRFDLPTIRCQRAARDTLRHWALEVTVLRTSSAIDGAAIAWFGETCVWRAARPGPRLLPIKRRSPSLCSIRGCWVPRNHIG